MVEPAFVLDIKNVHWTYYRHGGAYAAHVRALVTHVRGCANSGHWVNARAYFYRPMQHSGPGWYFGGVVITYQHGGTYLRETSTGAPVGLTTAPMRGRMTPRHERAVEVWTSMNTRTGQPDQPLPMRGVTILSPKPARVLSQWSQ